MKHLSMETTPGGQLTLDALYLLCPQCFAEVVDEDGKERRIVDFDKLKLILGENSAEGMPESFDFTWVGKRAAMRDAAAPIRKALRPCPEESVNWDSTKNIYIEGDNLEVLKLLQNSYMNKVKVIYIDPPYNTGNDFVYRDDFAMSVEEYNEANEIDGNRFRKNVDTSGRYHSNWCSMMYSRLLIARSLLREDGVIFISIDFHEFHSLKQICNQIFGEKNYVGEIVWQTATDNNPTQISLEHEYVLCYAKNMDKQPKWGIPSEKAKAINEKYQELKKIHGLDLETIRKDLKKWIKEHENELKGATHYSYVDDKGVYYPGNSSNTKPGGYTFDIIHPVTKKVCSKPAYGYRWTEETFLDAARRGDVEWGATEETIPKIKKRVETVTESLKSYYYEDNRYWTKFLNNMFGRRVFENPKSCNFLTHIMEFTTDKDSIVLDFFSGSASTAHAVMMLNQRDGGHRQCILVQWPEKTEEKSEAFKAGYKTICEIGRERIRRCGKLIGEEIEKNGTPEIDLGFRAFVCDESNMKEVYFTPTSYNQGMLDGLEDNVKEDRGDLDLLFDCMLRWGVELSTEYTSSIVDGCTIYNVNEGDMIACFAGEITDEVIKHIAGLNPVRVVFRDNSFVSDSKKLNLFEQFKQLCNWSDEEVRNNIRVI